jgi:hypothetical protein
MRILIDISHPAHAHFFKNAITDMKKRGHVVKIASRIKDINIDLLNAMGIEHQPLSAAPVSKSIVAFSTELIVHCYRLFRLARRFKPDIMLQIAGTFIAPVGKLLRIPTIGFYDTEFARLSNAISYPLLSYICTPQCYQGDIGGHHVRYPGYHELAYLHPDVFSPDESILREYGISKDEKYFIVRFVGWNALHDYSEKGFNIDSKHNLVEKLANYGRVIITSEESLPRDLEKYRSKIPIDKIHDVMAFASLVIGESATMASEAAVLGVPAIFISTTGRGYTDEQEKRYGLVQNFNPHEQQQCLNAAINLVSKPLERLRKEYKSKRNQLLMERIDTTAWMVRFIETTFNEKLE